ncbi:MAG: hypothetical protein U0893_05690 [Chloroflexota bacterium]
MSRRWYRYGGRQVFVGWDRSLQSFFLTIAELCKNCDGYGEEPDSDNFCVICGGDGIEMGFENPTGFKTRPTIDEIGPELAKLGIPFPDAIRADLEHDRAVNAGEVLQEYAVDPELA